jgi:HK97 family phage major capsid protein
MTIEEMRASLSKTEGVVAKIAEDAAGFTKRAQEDIAKFGAITGETSGKMQEVLTMGKKAAEEAGELRTRLFALEQKIAARPHGNEGQDTSSPGDVVVKSSEFKSLNPNSRNMGSVEVKSFHKTAIVNATGQNQPLVPADRLPGIVMPGMRRLTIRDLLPSLPTQSNLIEYAKENVFTNSAAPQHSAGVYENVSKAESGITFTLATEAVRTLAHFVPASRQVLSDAPMLAGYINGRLTYGLKLKEEAELLNGDNIGGNLHGLNTQATAFSQSIATNDQQLDILLKAMLQVFLSEYTATGVVLSPIDWTAIQLLKDTQGRYLFSNPGESKTPQVWGLPVVPTQSQTSGDFLVGSFAQACSIFDREDATVRVAEQHSDFFVKNMVAILAEERLALVVFRAAALVKGSF